MEQWNQNHTMSVGSVHQQTPSSSSSHLSQKGDIQYVLRQVTDNVRYAIIEEINMRPAIWDLQREKVSAQNRKGLFMEVADAVNQQFALNPRLSVEEVEKNWKNLKDTYVKTRKKIAFDHEGCVIRPKWKFFEALMFLDSSFNQVEFSPKPIKRIRTDIAPTYYGPSSLGKKLKPPEEPQKLNDEFMSFCKSLYFPLREIGLKNRMEFLKTQKAIRDLIHEVQMETLAKNDEM